jgi:hypothetical protein
MGWLKQRVDFCAGGLPWSFRALRRSDPESTAEAPAVGA